MSETIYALASGPPPSGVAVIRVSGPDVFSIGRAMAGRELAPRHASYAMLRDKAGRPLDRAVALLFPGPRSFTGEDVLELQCHGGRAVVEAIGRCLREDHGVRHAEPGEFTLRAHLNGRIDLVEAERLGDLVHAETEAQHRLAMSDLGRRNAMLYETWRTDLTELRALVEASLDFADEDDAPVTISPEAKRRLSELRDALAQHLDGTRAVEIVRDGFRVVLTGPPNAGKSSLLNALAAREVAIVTAVPGTTRDVLDVPLDMGGYRVVLADTAGLREAEDEVEAIGVARARERIADADLVLDLRPPGGSMPSNTSPADHRVVPIGTKVDLDEPSPGTALGISAVTGEGLEELIALIADRAARDAWRDRDGGPGAPLAERHVRHLRRCLEILPSPDAEPDELWADALRRAAGELGRITGSADIERVYDVIFSRFCMGK